MCAAHHKLVRDKIPEIIAAAGCQRVTLAAGSLVGEEAGLGRLAARSGSGTNVCCRAARSSSAWARANL